METLEALGKRIETTRDLKSIVRTMKSLAAASIRQYEQAAESLQQYSETVRLGMQVVLQAGPAIPAEEARPENGVGVVVVGSDHGLCGQFNEQIAQFAAGEMAREAAGEREVLWAVVGRRSVARLEAEGLVVEREFATPGTADKIATTVHALLLLIDEWRAARRAARLVVFHNARQGIAAAAPRRAQLFPLDPAWLRRLGSLHWKSRTLPAFTMERESLFTALVRHHLFITLYRAVAESLASEQASRLAAMQVAEKNIEQHLSEMIADFQRKRQDSITEELLDIVSGYEVTARPAGGIPSREPPAGRGDQRRRISPLSE